MCRQVIPHDFVERPELVPEPTPRQEVAFEGGYQWFYEGRNGWWQYDERTSAELEAASKREARRCEVLIAGFIYTIDFDQMVQMRRDHPSRRRRIKRDLVTIAKKGIAGIRMEPVQPPATEGPVAPVTEQSPPVDASGTAVPCREGGAPQCHPASVALGDHSYVACGEDSELADRSEDVQVDPPIVDIIETAVVGNVLLDLTRDDGEVIEVPTGVWRLPSTRRRRPPRRWYYEDFL